MDIYIRGIKTFCCLAPKRHTKHKTIRVFHKKQITLCGLLNAHIVVADFTKCLGIDRCFLYVVALYVCFHCDRPLMHLHAWQCYIAKYP